MSDVAFPEFVAEHQIALRRYALALTGDPSSADDLVQETLVKLYLAWGRLERHAELGGYARKTLMREWISSWRRFERQERTSDALPETPVAGGYDTVDAQDLLWRELRKLGPRQRAVVTLRYLDDLDEKSIAAELGISVGTVKSQLSRALATLRTALEGTPR